jgi:hypothetical protein
MCGENIYWVKVLGHYKAGVLNPFCVMVPFESLVKPQKNSLKSVKQRQI